MRLIFTIFFLSSFIQYAQNSKVEQILEEGKLLYRTEKASWYGTDDFLERFKQKRDSIGGYLSYETENSEIATIFFSKKDPNKVIVRYKFDSLPKPTPISIDTLNTNANLLERDLIFIRQDALNRVNDDNTGFFKFYENTSLNFMPVITGNKRVVFILTGPQTNGYILLGNDYVLKYSKSNKFKNKEKIHNSLVQLQWKSEDPEKQIEQTIHSHVLSDYINSTDICTLLLYKNFIDWKKHIVISKKQVSIFDVEGESLFTLTTKAWKKINNHSE